MYAIRSYYEIQRIACLKYSRCIDKDKLRAGPMHDTQNAVAGGLGLFRSNGNFFTQHSVEQRGFAGIRHAHIV